MSYSFFCFELGMFQEGQQWEIYIAGSLSGSNAKSAKISPTAPGILFLEFKGAESKTVIVYHQWAVKMKAKWLYQKDVIDASLDMLWNKIQSSVGLLPEIIS